MNTETEVRTEKEIEEIIKQKDQEKEDIMKTQVVGFPKEFCGFLGDRAEGYLRKWMDQHAPNEIRILFDAFSFLRYAEDNDTVGPNEIDGKLDDSCICSSVQEAVWAIDKLKDLDPDPVYSTR